MCKIPFESRFRKKTFQCATKGSDTLESFLTKVAFESNLQKKLARIEHLLIVKVFRKKKNC